MNAKEVLRKADAGEGLTVAEVKLYQKLVKSVKHTYGKYGTLAKKYLEEHNAAKYWTIENLPEYLHGIDKAAERMYDVMYEKLSNSEQYKKNGDFIHDLQVETELRNRIDTEILNEIVYVD
ncbi:MAG: TnpV protein [Clostridia bacterium]|nr:TnpV protein [Clostridia bacterium]